MLFRNTEYEMIKIHRGAHIDIDRFYFIITMTQNYTDAKRNQKRRKVAGIMERMVIGKTGLEVNRFGFGGIPIQRVSESQAVETVFHAVEKGVDFIDTSRGNTTSERQIGLALKQTTRKVILASKSPNKTG